MSRQKEKECKHEYRLAEKYSIPLASETCYVFFCIHCLKTEMKRVEHGSEGEEVD